MNDILDDKQPQEPTPYPLTTAELMARLFEIRAAKADLTAQEKLLTEEYDNLSRELLRQMDEQGSTRVATTLGMAIRTKSVQPQVEDWDALYAHIRETDGFHLLQRRVSAPAFREILDSGEQLPGVVPFEEVKIQLRAA